MNNEHITMSDTLRNAEIWLFVLSITCMKIQKMMNV